MPEELEELNGFERGFTELEGVSDVRRSFFMGNALVVGIVTVIGRALIASIEQARKPVMESSSSRV